MSTFAEIKDGADSTALVRKALQGVGFWAPSSIELPTSLLDVDGSLKALPVDWRPIGIVGTDGYTFGTDINVEETEGWGYADPVRSDVSKAPKSVKMTPLQKFTRLVQELTQGADYSAIAASAAGEVVFEEPDIPEMTEGRLLVIGFDGTAANPFYMGKGFTKVKVNEIGDDQWSADADAAGQELTFSVGVGAEGFPVRHYFGGSAFDAVAYGFKANTP